MTYLGIGLIALWVVFCIINRNDYDAGGAALGIGCVLFVAWLGIGLVVEIAQHNRSFDARMACATKRQDYDRQMFTTRVVCIPAYRATKSDTLTVQTPDLSPEK